MSGGRQGWFLLALLGWLGPPAAAIDPPAAINPSVPGVGRSLPSEPTLSDRSRELLGLECYSHIGRRQIVLFANGTVRLKESSEPPSDVDLVGDLGPLVEPQQRMALREMGPEELDDLLRRLRAEDLSEVSEEDQGGGLDGSWVDRCRLDLELPATPARHYRFGRYDSLPLSFSRVVRTIEALAADMDAPEGPRESLPKGYQPDLGDRLQRVDGEVFEVVGLTADGKGVEMQGQGQPLTLFVAVDQLRGEFPVLVSRGRP